MRTLLVVLALASCSKRSPPPLESRLPILPEPIAAQLGTSGLALAIDFKGLDLMALLGSIPAQTPCARALIAGVRDAVATVGDGGWQGMVDGLPEAPTRACLTTLGIPMHAATGGLGIDAGGTSIVVAWRGDVATIVQAGATPRSGPAPQELLDVVAQVPHYAKAWLAVTGLPDYQITRAVGWLEVAPMTWTFTVMAQGSTPTAAKTWIDSIVRGFTVALAGRGVTVDGAWFTVTDQPGTATLVAAVPVAALGSN
jgi:hypothetical protein